MRQLVELGEVTVDTWGIFCLEINNSKKESLADSLEFRGAAALRTVIAVRDAAGNDGVGRFYAELAARTWDDTQDQRDPAVIEAALVAGGLDPGLYAKAMNDDSTWDRVVAEHQALVADTRSFGVPTIRLDGGRGPAIFGPVISVKPNDADVVPLWQSVKFLAGYDNFSELKRDRTTPPDLEAARHHAAERARKAAEEAKAASS